MKRLVLNRLQKLEDRTLGRLSVFSGLDMLGHFATLELPWKNNERGKSCILSAFYAVEPRTSERFDKHLIVLNVPGRDYILFHHGNFPADTNGCILVGTDFADINGDGKQDVFKSRTAMKRLISLVDGPAELIIL